VDANLNNAVAATEIGAFLRCLRKEGRNPDRWEADQTIRAMTFLACDRYDQAIDHIDRARIPPSKRDPAAVTNVEKAESHFAVPDLATLQAIFEEVCDAGEVFARLIG
jgi:hypothetical protein